MINEIEDFLGDGPQPQQRVNPAEVPLCGCGCACACTDELNSTWQNAANGTAHGQGLKYT
jgi:hypothetical protein